MPCQEPRGTHPGGRSTEDSRFNRHFQPPEKASVVAEPPQKTSENKHPGIPPTRYRIVEHREVSACRKATLTNPSKTKSKRIYRWEDENGVVNFSDKPPKKQEAERLNDDLFLGTSRFSLDLTFDGMRGLPGFEDAISTGTQRIYDFLRLQLNQLNLPPVHVKVAVVNGKKRFRRYRKKLAPRTQTTSGFYTFAENLAVVRHRQKNQQRTLQVIRHEVLHLIVGNLYGDVDTWLNEGLAEFFERLEGRSLAKQTQINPKNLSLLRKRLRRGTLPSMKRLMSTSYKEWYATDVHLMYVYAWSVIHHLVSTNPGQRFLSALLAEQRKQRCKTFSARAYVENFYPGGLASLEREWKRWLFDNGDKTLYF